MRNIQRGSCWRPAKIDKGVYTEPIRITLGEWLDTWLKEYTGNMKPHTKKSYEATAKTTSSQY